jgi:hypothetical protein
MIFKSKKKKQEEEKKEFKVVLWEDVGYLREIKTIQCDRFVDEDKTPFIENKDEKFAELYPKDEDELIKYDIKVLKANLKKKEDTLTDIRGKDIEDYKEDEPNTLDLEHEIKRLKAKIRGNKFSNKSSFAVLSKGQVTYNFLRKGNTFYPFKWDAETTTIHTASEPVVKKAGILLRNKNNKYDLKRLLETSVVIMAIIFIVGTLVNIWFGGWLWSKYDDSNLGELARNEAENNKKINDILTDVLNNTNECIEKNQYTNIEGILPS